MIYIVFNSLLNIFITMTCRANLLITIVFEGIQSFLIQNYHSLPFLGKKVKDLVVGIHQAGFIDMCIILNLMKSKTVQSFYYLNIAMKEKFSIFSPNSAKTDALQSSINFKKSPIKFTVCEPNNKPKELPKYSAYQSISSTNLDQLKKLPHQYSNLRQTLSYKTPDFDSLVQQQERQKHQKPSNILRQTINSKPTFKPRSQKIFSETISGHEFQPTNESYNKHELNSTLGYSKITNLTQSKSSHSLYDSKYVSKKTTEPKKTQDKYNDWRQTYKNREEQKQKEYKATEQQCKIVEQIQILKKIAGKNNEQQSHKQIKTLSSIERKHSQNVTYSSYKPQNEDSVFRKKAREKEEQTQQCYTPKLPKYTYQQRFKKVGSPTSTDNSDSRSPPNKFVDHTDTKKKNGKISIEDFVIGKTLGQGKFGVVMIARHKRSGFLIALKKIPKAMIKSHFMVDQLILQIRLQSCLNHKNILSMYGFFDDVTHLYIVLEYMEQGTLYSQLKKNKILSEKQAAVIVKQMTEAVQYLHDQDIAHRDIKPQNIVISNNVYKLCDFGWATLCNQRRKTYCGTFDYAAPQILQGKEYDMSVDLWCLGVLTYELLTGKAPFYHLSRKETMKKIINVSNESIIYPQNMSKQAVDFIEKLIRKDPNERMKSSDALKHPYLKNAEDL